MKIESGSRLICIFNDKTLLGIHVDRLKLEGDSMRFEIKLITASNAYHLIYNN